MTQPFFIDAPNAAPSYAATGAATGARRRQLLAAALGVVAVRPSFAEDVAARNRQLYMYSGADREAMLVQEAKKEGQVSVYTSLNTRDSGPLCSSFEKKYGVRVKLWRSSSEKVLQRAVTEARAGRHLCDVLETNGPEMEAMYREKLLAEFKSPLFKELAPAAFPKHRHYVADRFNFFVIGWNTNLVKPEEVPNSYEDLLSPRFAGKVGVEAGDTDWFASMVKSMGEQQGMDFFRRLAKAKPQIRTGHTLIGELLSSGELGIAAAIYNHSVEKMTLRGAPVRWKALAPTFGRPNAIGVALQAPRPHAALLFVDFMLSKEGQSILRDHSRVPANLTVETQLNKFAFEMIDPAIVLDENDKWERHWSELFLNGQKVQRETE